MTSVPAIAQVRLPSDGGTITSLGQPRSLKWTVGGGAGRHFRSGEGQALVEGRVAVQRDLLNPLASIAALHAELYLGYRDRALERGVRARFMSPAGRFGIGADYGGLDARTDLLLTFMHPGRRGGLLGDGSTIRIDYVPRRDHTFTIGVERPIRRRIPMGRTRPDRDHVRISRPALPALARPDAGPALDQALASARDAAGWIRRLGVPFVDHGAWNRREADAAFVADITAVKAFLGGAVADGNAGAMGLATEVRRYHEAIELAFSMAASRSAPDGDATTADGELVASKARSILLSEVLFPYNRLLGQTKREDTLAEFAGNARGVFVRWLHVDSKLKAEQIDAAAWVFAELLDIIEANRAAARAQWRDSRFVWLPLQYALLPEQHDTQAELDTLVEQAVGDRFTEGNFVSYVINEQFQYHLSRTIRAAEDYHVLWTHDFRGKDANGDLDEMSFRHVILSYFRAMTDRVRSYDSTATFPVYMIILDEWFYQVTGGRTWLNVLEDPTAHRLRLPPEYDAWEQSLAAAQEALRAAIDSSVLLQAQRRQYGDDWLRNLVKVHVNITNPADPSFWSRSVIPPIPLPDNMMRDHRKVAFYDITEEDPYRGEALYTGAGVGEHYANLAWEDRSLLVRGPVALRIKRAARETLLQQGIRADRIPLPLQPRAKAADYDDRIRAELRRDDAQSLRALELHNGTGFAAKDVNVAKAVLYTLMPPGSVIKIPDSLWSGSFWGSALLGCAMRGVRVLIIAPAIENAPAQAFGTQGRSHELLWRLLTAERLLAPEIAASGGLLKVGLFAPDFEVTNIPAKVRAVEVTFSRHAWLRDLFGFPPSVYEELEVIASTLDPLFMRPGEPPEFEYDTRPQLHLKANFFASREAWTLLSRPDWPGATWEFLQQRIAQVQTRNETVRTLDGGSDALLDAGRGMVQDWFARLDPDTRERVVFYTVVGSQNQNYRSMIIDGEVGLVISRWPSIIPYLDLISIVGQSHWLEQPSDLKGRLPESSAWRWRIGRWVKLVL
ncbi:MAG TPA: hypothetical protein VMM18_18220 [Gemmatimonadaceae bacterium]|nr:hypothetical protein [Gemmatimonadaceae bacterium]